MSTSWMFCPGHDPKKLQKALAGAAEVVIADWEDAVPFQKKSEARQVTAEASRSRTDGKRLFVRINGARTEMHSDDLIAIESLEIDGIMLPKSEYGGDAKRLCALGLPVVALIESAIGVEHARQIGEADPKVERLAFGSLDFCADIGGRWTPSGEAYSHARQKVVLAGRAAGKLGPLDGVWPRLGDIEGLRRDADLGRSLGFSGKMLIHPEQIEPVQIAFRPNEAELERASRIVAASREAERAGESALRLDGEFVDPPVVRWAHSVLQQAGRQAGEDG